ncbi:hypothetical protein [Halothece sp. PCC 7418]|uniref:hypothetical protein n=1 Tax=Halothece sp. (strain PCC 7418) TaxID=65093 RepID=UPI0002FBB869|nr:hypothetical protein [Halothece sp. PCC 7418]
MTNQNSLIEALEPVKPFISEELIDETGWQQINALAKQLPCSITRFFGFECRLGVATAETDFLLCITRDGRGKNFLDGSEVSPFFSETIFQKPVWSQLQNFVTAWQDPSSLFRKRGMINQVFTNELELPYSNPKSIVNYPPFALFRKGENQQRSINQVFSNELELLYHHIQNIWLEFDLPRKGQPDLLPSCFLGLSSLGSQVITKQYAWLTKTTLPLLRGTPLSSQLEKQLLSCINALPKQGIVSFIGLMLARQWQTIRICLKGIAPSELINYLKKVQWSGSTTALQTALNSGLFLVDDITLTLEIGEMGVMPKIGFECYFNQQPKFESRWEQFLDYLVKTDLCLPEKQEALLSYPGYLQQGSPWPGHWVTLANFLGRDSILIRRINHIKLTFEQDRMLEAKAYPSVRYMML